MGIAIKWGVILGVAVGALGFIFGGAGLQVSPVTAMGVVGIAFVINVVVVILAVREARHTATWAAQLLNGVVIGLVGAVIIFIASWVMTFVVFPDYYQQLADGYREFFQNAGMTEAQIAEAMRDVEQATPVSGALSGSTGTVLTSIVVAAIAGIFLRRKQA